MKETLYKISAAAIILASILNAFIPDVAKWIMIVAVSMYTAIVFTTKYKGANIRIKRLHNFFIFSSLFMVVSAYLMYNDMKEWVITMVIAAIFLLYASFAIGKEQAKSNKDEE